jgi:hypothetical protein
MLWVEGRATYMGEWHPGVVCPDVHPSNSAEPSKLVNQLASKVTNCTIQLVQAKVLFTQLPGLPL